MPPKPAARRPAAAVSGLPNLSVRQLHAVTLVAKYASFAAAAMELRLSQPGLSRIISKAEQELGVALFHRTTRNVVLTTAGADFVPIAERILLDLHLGTDAIRDLRAQNRGQVAIGCPMAMAQSILVEIVADYRRRHPNVLLHIREWLQSAILEDIRSGVVDFGIGFASQPAEDLVFERLYNGAYHVVFHREHRFAQQRVVGLHELQGEPMVSMPPSANLRQIFDGAAASAGFRLNHAVTVNTYSTVFEFIRARIGITILADPGVPAPDDPVLCSRPIDPPRVEATLAVMSLKSRPLSPAALGLKRLIQARFLTYTSARQAAGASVQ